MQSTEDFEAPSTKERDAELGEKYAALAHEYGKLAGGFLFRSQWGYGAPEWYDHRLPFLDPERHQTDFWTASADNVLRVLPMGGKLLDLCSGDGFYDYWFYRLRADVTCVEKNEEAYEFSKKHYSHPKITFVLQDIMEWPCPGEYFDVVLIRGAIEHFTAADQAKIVRTAHFALKPGGWFCGDTPLKAESGKALEAHAHEWESEDEGRMILSRIFNHVETWTLSSEYRMTVFWRCRK